MPETSWIRASSRAFNRAEEAGDVDGANAMSLHMVARVMWSLVRVLHGACLFVFLWFVFSMAGFLRLCFYDCVSSMDHVCMRCCAPHFARAGWVTDLVNGVKERAARTSLISAIVVKKGNNHHFRIDTGSAKAQDFATTIAATFVSTTILRRP